MTNHQLFAANKESLLNRSCFVITLFMFATATKSGRPFASYYWLLVRANRTFRNMESIITVLLFPPKLFPKLSAD